MSPDRVDLGSAKAVRVGRVTLYPATRRLVRDDGAEEVVEPRVMQVLIHLVSERGQIVQRATLVQRCWDGLSISDDAINRVASRLRRLAEGIGAGSFELETIPRIGYRLIDLNAPLAASDQPTWKAVFFGWLRRPAAQVGIAVTLALTAGSAALLLDWQHGKTPEPDPIAHQARLPEDPAAAALFLQARDNWAERSPESLSRSIMQFERVTRIEPDFAPAFAGLADAYLLAGEVASLPGSISFDGASNAAERALKLDPQSSEGYRARGFVQYWQRHDASAAGASFRQAIRIDPASSQTHFWYANILADNGESRAALREFSSARLIDPGSDQIDADYAWALWIMGLDKEAHDRLTATVEQHPKNAEALDCLATIDFAKGDFPEYLQLSRRLAQLRLASFQSTRIEALENSYKQGGPAALLRKKFELEMGEQADSAYPDHSGAAFTASVAGDRKNLLAALLAADAASEHWGAYGFVRRMQIRWRGDGAVLASLHRRAGARVES